MRVMNVVSKVSGLKFEDGAAAGDQAHRAIIEIDKIVEVDFRPVLNGKSNIVGHAVTARLTNGDSVVLATNSQPKDPAKIAILDAFLTDLSTKIADSTLAFFDVTAIAV